MEDQLKRLNKYIGETGFCSRREADALIEQNRVTVNGEPAVMGMKVTNDDEVRIDGKLVRDKNEKPVYLAFNKPPGIECTTNLEVNENIIDFINYPKRIFPIGRLDKASEGLIFMTNDGDIVNKILRARNNHEKEYTVTVDKPITSRFIDRMGNGIPILDTVTRKCKVEQISKYTFKIILTQGLNRQIRRMCEYLGYEVTKLIRIRIINITLDLPTGRYRDLTDAEIKELNQLIEPSSGTEEASLDKVESRKSKVDPRLQAEQYGAERNKSQTQNIERRTSNVERTDRSRTSGERVIKPYDKRKSESTDDNRSNDTPARQDFKKPSTVKRNVEFVKREDSKVPNYDKPEAANREAEFIKKEDSKTFDRDEPREKRGPREPRSGGDQRPSARPASESQGPKKWKVEFIKKDDPDYKKPDEV